MKQQIDLTQQNLSDQEMQFLLIHIKRKYHTDMPVLTIGMCIELLIGLTYNFHTDYSDGRFFNNILTNQESLIAWEGKELIDILFYEIRKSLKRLLKTTPDLL